MKYLKNFIKEKKMKTALTLFMLLLQVVGTLLIPFLIADIVDMGILKQDIDAILIIGVKMLIVSVLTTIFAVLGSYYSADLAASFGSDMRSKLFCKSQELSIREFDTIGVSSMITRTTSDISNLQQIFGLAFQLILPAPMIVVAAIVMTAESSPVLALALTVCVALFLLISAIIMKKSTSLSEQIQVRLDSINKVVRENITGIRVIRAFGNEKYEETRAGNTFASYAENMIKLNKLFAIQNPAVWLLMGLAMAATVWLGSVLTMSGSMEIGKITAVIEYAVMTLGYLIMATSVMVTLPKMRACLERLEEVLTIDPEIRDLVDADRNNACEILCKPASHISLGSSSQTALEFENVTFFYPGAEEPVIKDLSFKCLHGQTTAIIGSTGSGKSTIANLILRLHDISSGDIRLESTDIRTLPQQKLRESIGYVPQKAFLFSGTIADNLRMGKKEATELDMRRALEISQAETFVTGLENGLESFVSQGGSNFSGGQKQRLSIARAIIKDAPLLIFDDSFSALDLKTDSALRRALKENITETAKIIIAQRVSTIKDADQILVLDEGRLAGAGRHSELMENCPVYQEIAKSQMKEA